MLSARHVSKSFGDAVAALDDVSIDVPPGKLVCLFGRSGSGKTTLARALSLIEHPDSGTVTVGTDIYQFPLSSRKQPIPWPKVTVVFQTLFLWPHLTLRESILLPLRRYDPDEYEPRFSELIDVFAMASFIDRHPNEVSIGQRQRAAVVRAILLNPSYVIIDEPTSALDAEQSGVILREIKKLPERGIGVLVITHHLGFVRRSDVAYFIDKGRIVESGGGDIVKKPSSPRLAEFLKAADELRWSE